MVEVQEILPYRGKGKQDRCTENSKPKRRWCLFQVEANPLQWFVENGCEHFEERKQEDKMQ
jgi:hypothetical protein